MSQKLNPSERRNGSWRNPVERSELFVRSARNSKTPIGGDGYGTPFRVHVLKQKSTRFRPVLEKFSVLATRNAY